MQKRPPIFFLLSLFLVGVAISLPIQIMIQYSHGLFALDSVFFKMTRVNLLVMACCLVNAALSWRASKHLMYAIPLNVILVAWNNYLVGAYYANPDVGSDALLSFLVFAGVCATLASKASRKVLSDQKLRYWLVPSRFKVHVPASLHTMDGKRISGATFDLSHSGTFFPCPIAGLKLKSPYVTIKLSTGPLRELKLDAEVVRVSARGGRYPEGLGLRFMKPQGTDEGMLRKLLKTASLDELRV